MWTAWTGGQWVWTQGLNLAKFFPLCEGKIKKKNLMPLFISHYLEYYEYLGVSNF